jgi:hypothetical protein
VGGSEAAAVIERCDQALALAAAGDPFAGRHLIEACAAARDLLEHFIATATPKVSGAE